MSLISILEAGRRDFLDATSGLSSDIRPRSGWSVVECVEHVITAEDRYLSWILNGQPIEPRRDAEKELRLFAILRSRLTKVETPEVYRPTGRFDSLQAALAGFKEVRDRSVQLARERGDAIYSVGVAHPHFGEMNGAEMMQLMDGHARRHAEQIREIIEEMK